MKVSHFVLSMGVSLAALGCDKPAEPRPLEQPNQPPATDQIQQGEPIPAPVTEREDVEEAAEDQEEAAEEAAEEADELAELLEDGAATLSKMAATPELKELLNKASAVFVVPSYGRAALAIGGHGGDGMLLTRKAGQWSEPLFYEIGGVSLGVQLGAEGGDLALILMSPSALELFQNESAFSINSDAKLTLVDYSRAAQANLDEDVGDVVFWSDTKGAFVGASLSATHIEWEDDENRAYYGRDIKPQAGLEQALKPDAPSAHARALQETLAKL